MHGQRRKHASGITPEEESLLNKKLHIKKAKLIYTFGEEKGVFAKMK